jgi:hypothetical protein
MRFRTTMASRSINGVRRQSRRVAAWLYTVVNPVLDSLGREVHFLEHGNVTWRANTRRCEFILTIQEYIQVEQWPNYSDFLAEHTAFKSAFKRHDAGVERLNAVALESFKWLQSWKEFSDTLSKLVEQYERQIATSPALGPPLNEFRRQLSDMASENVINNTQSLPSHYIIAKFWDVGGSQLLQFRNLPRFAPLNAASEDLARTSARVKRALEVRRLQLSREFDVPAAPVPGLFPEV